MANAILTTTNEHLFSILAVSHEQLLFLGCQSHKSFDFQTDFIWAVKPPGVVQPLFWELSSSSLQKTPIWRGKWTLVRNVSFFMIMSLFCSRQQACFVPQVTDFSLGCWQALPYNYNYFFIIEHFFKTNLPVKPSS